MAYPMAHIRQQSSKANWTHMMMKSLLGSFLPGAPWRPSEAFPAGLIADSKFPIPALLPLSVMLGNQHSHQETQTVPSSSTKLKM